MARKTLIDILVRGILVKLGRAIDKVTGRNWQPSSSLAASELIEKIKKLMDYEAKKHGNGKFVPHQIKIKIQWDKFSSAGSLEKLRNELLIAIVDYINDNQYHTYAPLKLEIKSDYFVDGVILQADFGEFVAGEAEIKILLETEKEEIAKPKPEISEYKLIVEFISNSEKVEQGEKKVKELEVRGGELVSIGRAKENRLVIEHGSVSKIHANLRVGKDGKIYLSDAGSTNGTFINEERILAGKAFVVNEGDRVRFGMVEATFRLVQQKATEEDAVFQERTQETVSLQETVNVGETIEDIVVEFKEPQGGK